MSTLSLKVWLFLVLPLGATSAGVSTVSARSLPAASKCIRASVVRSGCVVEPAGGPVWRCGDRLVSDGVCVCVDGGLSSVCLMDAIMDMVQANESYAVIMVRWLRVHVRGALMALACSRKMFSWVAW